MTTTVNCPECREPCIRRYGPLGVWHDCPNPQCGWSYLERHEVQVRHTVTGTTRDLLGRHFRERVERGQGR